MADTLRNGKPVKHPHAAALARGAKALRAEARKWAFDAALYGQGHRGAGLKRAWTTHRRLLRQAGELEQLAGRRKAD